MTRYPKSGKGKKWTQLELKAVRPGWAGDIVSDGGGLTGEIRLAQDQSISIRFRYAFKWASKVAWFQCGTWPIRNLEEIRSARDNARQLLKQGVNPTDQRHVQRIETRAQVESVLATAEMERSFRLTFKDMFNAWLEDGVRRKDDNAELKRSFAKDVLPSLADIEVRSVNEHALRKLLREVVMRGCNRTSVVTYRNLVQLFRWAEKRKPWRQLLVEGNPTDLIEIRKIVSSDYDINDERERILSSVELIELQDIFSTLRKNYSTAVPGKKYSVPRPFKREGELSLWISLSTLCRIGELLKAKWNEIDFDSRYWHIPLENVKGSVGKKKAHRVWLSDFSMQKLLQLRELTGESEYLFPSRNHDEHVCVKSVSKQVGDRQTSFKKRTKVLKNRRNDNSLVLMNGENGEWTPHDLRRTGATMMQALGVLPHVIDRCQNHVMEGSKVRRSYLHHEYRDEKRLAWSLLGQQLSTLLLHEVQLPVTRPTRATNRILIPDRTQLNVAN